MNYIKFNKSNFMSVNRTIYFIISICFILLSCNRQSNNSAINTTDTVICNNKSKIPCSDTVEKAEKLKLDKSKNVRVVSQTTFNYKKFQDLVEIIKKKEYNICISNTICNATEERQNEARRIARRADAMIVIGDSSSSNTRKLYEICKTECQETFYIQTLSGLELDKLKSSDCIGITAGASTPNNIIEEVYTNVRRKLCTDVR